MKTNNLLTEKVELGKTGITISPLGIGTWQWGDQIYWRNDNKINLKDETRKAFEISIENGINLFDTAEVYGLGKSEKVLSELISSTDSQIVLASKFMPFTWRLFRWQFRHALKNSLKRLGLQSIDLYQIHFPLPPVPIKVWLEEMVKAHQDGLIKAVGVSNFDLEQTKTAHRILKSHDIPLASNQVRYSLIDRKIEENGILDYCRENSITVLAYSPLGQGVLPGKYSPDNPPPGIRSHKYNRHFFQTIQPLLDLMGTLGRQHDKTHAQIALNWAICKGTVPIPGARTTRQAEQNAGALGWRLDEAEIIELDKASRQAIRLLY